MPRRRKDLTIITDETKMYTDEVWESVTERLPWRKSKLFKVLRYRKTNDFECKTVRWVLAQRGVRHEFSVIDQLSWKELSQLMALERNNKHPSTDLIQANLVAFFHINKE